MYTRTNWRAKYTCYHWHAMAIGRLFSMHGIVPKIVCLPTISIDKRTVSRKLFLAKERSLPCCKMYGTRLALVHGCSVHGCACMHTKDNNVLTEINRKTYINVWNNNEAFEISSFWCYPSRIIMQRLYPFPRTGNYRIFSHARIRIDVLAPEQSNEMYSKFKIAAIHWNVMDLKFRNVKIIRSWAIEKTLSFAIHFEYIFHAITFWAKCVSVGASALCLCSVMEYKIKFGYGMNGTPTNRLHIVSGRRLSNLTILDFIHTEMCWDVFKLHISCPVGVLRNLLPFDLFALHTNYFFTFDALQCSTRQRSMSRTKTNSKNTFIISVGIWSYVVWAIFCLRTESHRNKQS